MQGGIPWERPVYRRPFLSSRTRLHIAYLEMLNAQCKRVHIQAKKFHKVRVNPLTL